MSFPLFPAVQRNHLICCPPFAGFLLSSIPRAAFGATEPPLKPCRAKEAEKERDPGRHTPRPAPLSTPLFGVSVLRLFPSTWCVWTGLIPPQAALLPGLEPVPASVPSPCTGPGAQDFYVECAKGEPEKGKGQETDTGKEEKPGKEERRGRRSAE